MKPKTNEKKIMDDGQPLKLVSLETRYLSTSRHLLIPIDLAVLSRQQSRHALR